MGGNRREPANDEDGGTRRRLIARRAVTPQSMLRAFPTRGLRSAVELLGPRSTGPRAQVPGPDPKRGPPALASVPGTSGTGLGCTTSASPPAGWPRPSVPSAVARVVSDSRIACLEPTDHIHDRSARQPNTYHCGRSTMNRWMDTGPAPGDPRTASLTVQVFVRVFTVWLRSREESPLSLSHGGKKW